MQQLILDPEGAFYYNSGRFTFVDPTTGVVFEPSIRIKTKPTEWMLGQPVLKLDEPEPPAPEASTVPQEPEGSTVPPVPPAPQEPPALTEPKVPQVSDAPKPPEATKAK